MCISCIGLRFHIFAAREPCIVVVVLAALGASMRSDPVSASRGPQDEDIFGTRMEAGRVDVTRSTVDTNRISVHNRTSVGATVVRRTFRPAPYLCMRIDAGKLFGLDIVLNNRALRTLSNAANRQGVTALWMPPDGHLGIGDHERIQYELNPLGERQIT
ncbi:hypothetical protein EVAR_99549_1 [Eumeta japonica]|uniref:Uncharacterized protein n=1 Tax=Eumeta variegata TaxID=151549 RepID=A0A4C1YSR9_EUMVA|nr:hypothetical protein EVAR_99549_1 [Eumeta japonica]